MMSGIAVFVCGETGDKLTTPLRIDGDDEAGWISTLIPEASNADSPCWRFIDRYGDTIFNTLQLPVFIQELDHIARGASRRQQGRLLEIRALAEFAQSLPHRYLKFVGD